MRVHELHCVGHRVELRQPVGSAWRRLALLRRFMKRDHLAQRRKTGRLLAPSPVENADAHQVHVRRRKASLTRAKSVRADLSELRRATKVVASSGEIGSLIHPEPQAACLRRSTIGKIIATSCHSHNAENMDRQPISRTWRQISSDSDSTRR